MSNRYYLEEGFIVDNKAELAWDDIIHNPVDLLNEQDQRIIDLEKENEELKLKITTKNNALNFAENSYSLLLEENKN